MTTRTLGLRPGTPVLWRRAGESQLGADPATAVVLEGLTTSEQRCLDLLAAGVGSASALARAARCDRDRARRLLQRLAALGLLAEGAPARPAQVSPVAAARVVVVGAPALGLLTARLLVASGVGTVEVEDAGVVTPQDVGPWGYGVHEVGTVRERTAIGALRRVRPDVVTRAGDEPDLVVLVESRVAVPFRSSGLVRQDLAHLSVVVGEHAVEVGPAVRPGRHACLRCLDLRRRDRDPCWPALATQLAVLPVPALPDHVLCAAGGTVAAAALAVLTSTGDAPWEETWSVATGTPRRRRWAPHPECGCGAQVDARAG